ncbi:subclass B3 metallo-beta-lactamase [Rhodanobacter sp. MP7CTX1]|uniref:subclass B3 metallo-beta-lactamase n=1 Tax=Rhodanobacter sp. MP7CTX1 TaxID=2723084 RepID=UPI0017A29BD3|nr:subclass B3 metallo-beta-lactamase [Rhodanobacter sp. MP7CTX1]MBB6185891.1 metallo-beta-lactamase class B [Rhodanobacter sp. MP7CTX1]
MAVLKRMVFGAFVLAALSNQAFGASAPDTHASWTTPIKPFRIYGNSFYVGSKGLSAVLVTSPQGHILIDGTLKQNAPLIEANIRAAGFKLSDIKAIVNSHAHSDHAGALAQLAKDTGAPVYASRAGALALRLGGKDPQDPQYDGNVKFPPVDAKVVADLGHVRVGDLDLVGHATPGHTPGSMSWTWQSCEKGKCLHMVYSDSLTAITNGTYRYTDDVSRPQRVEQFRQSIAKIRGMPCDILMTVHPEASDFPGRAMPDVSGRRPKGLVGTSACRRLADQATQTLDSELADEKGTDAEGANH